MAEFKPDLIIFCWQLTSIKLVSLLSNYAHWSVCCSFNFLPSNIKWEHLIWNLPYQSFPCHSSFTNLLTAKVATFLSNTQCCCLKLQNNYSQDVHSSCLSTGQHCNVTLPEAFPLVEHLLLAFPSCFVCPTPFVICLTHCVRTEFCCFYHVSPFVLLATFPLQGQSCCQVILSCHSCLLLKDKAATRLCCCSLFLCSLRTKLLPGNWSYCSLFLLKKKAATRLLTFCV